VADQQQSPPAGWYQDPQGQGQRYWDGGQWTQHTQPAAAQPGPAAPAQPQVAGAPVAAVRPTREPVAIPPALWVALGAAVLTIIGGFGPWYEIGDTTIAGTSEAAGDGWVNVALGVIAGVFLAVWFANRRAVWQFIVAAVLGAISTISAIIDYADVSDSSSSGLFQEAISDPKWGLYLALIGSAALTIAAVVAAVTARR
jgi:Protein of unknown function (DUF2510)